MTIILSIETSTEIASVALLMPNKLFCAQLSGVQTHSLGVLPAIQDLFLQAKIKLNECDAIAYGCGPGAFTGVRTACGIVQGLAFGMDIPVLPVSGLLAMAEAEKSSIQNTSIPSDFICILDARMGEVYWAHYRFFEDHWSEISPPHMSVIQVVLEYAHNLEVTFVVGNGIDQACFHSKKHVVMRMPHAKEVAALGLHHFHSGFQMNAELAQPLYLRNKVALTSIERIQEKALRERLSTKMGIE